MDAWLAAIRLAGAMCIVVCDSASAPANVPAPLAGVAVWTGEPEWHARAEELLGGSPDTVFLWWGLGRLTHDPTTAPWSRSRRVLCVDTLPNAASIAGEVRESLRAIASARGLSGFVCASDEMGELLRARVPSARRLPVWVVPSPFPLTAHVGARNDYDDVSTGRPLKFVFSGRTDYLEHAPRGMLKDKLGYWLREFMDLGEEIYVQEPDDREYARHLERTGYRFYRRADRDGIVYGSLSRVLAEFDAQLVHYAIPNHTIRRRVSVGLSTRFATALCSSSPIVVPRESRFARQLVEGAGIGLLSSDPRVIVSVIRERGLEMNSNWWRRHSEWASESFAAELGEALGGENV